MRRGDGWKSGETEVPLRRSLVASQDVLPACELGILFTCKPNGETSDRTVWAFAPLQWHGMRDRAIGTCTGMAAA
jgi:hypothetical protein